MKMISMNIEDIIDVYNTYIESKRPDNVPKLHLVLHRCVSINPTFKAYKTYHLAVYVVNPTTKQNYCLLKEDTQVKLVNSSDDQAIKLIEKKFLLSLLEMLINTESNKSTLERIAYGEYSSSKDEQVPDPSY